MKHFVAPSFLAADFGNVQQEVEMVNESQADWLHVDVMDGRFVPNISIGVPVLKSIRQHLQKPLDLHLMIEHPDHLLATFYEIGVEHITVHYETCLHLHRTIHQIKEWGLKAGVALNPHTPVFLLEEMIQDIDIVTVMSVNPGFGGQSFIPNTLQKLQRLQQLTKNYDADPTVIVDGGVNLENSPSILQAGADVLVAGSTVFKSDNPTQTITELKNMTPQTAKEV